MSETGTATAGMTVCAHASQEHEDHEDDEHDGDHHRDLDVVDRGANRRRSVREHRQRDRRRDRRLERGQQRPNPVHRRDDVRAGLARHDDQHGRLAVGVSARPDVLDRVDDVGDVLQAHGGAVLVRRRRAADTRSPCRAGRSTAMLHDRAPVAQLPFGRLAFADPRNVRRSSRPSPSAFSTVGFTSTRTAGSAPPPTKTWPTPSTCAMRCCRTDEARSYICARLISLRRQREHHDGRVGRIDLPIARVARAGSRAAGLARR